MSEALVLNARQIAAMASPTRGTVYERLASRGEATAADVAGEAGISPATALYHLKQLAAVGLVVEAGERSSGKRPATVFRPTSQRLQLPLGDESVGLRLQAIQSSLRKCSRDLASRQGEGSHVLKIATRLSAADRATLTRMLEEAASFAKSKSTPDGQEVTWLSVISPPRRRTRVQ